MAISKKQIQKAENSIENCKYQLNDRFGKLTVRMVVFESSKTDEPDMAKNLILTCDCGYTFQVPIEEFEEKQYRSCGCDKLDNQLEKPHIKYKKSKALGEYAECQFSTVEDQDTLFTVDVDDVDLVVDKAKWFKTVDGHVRGRNNKTGEFYNIEDEIVNQHPDEFF